MSDDVIYSIDAIQNGKVKTADQYRKEVSKLSSMANKRLQRLEKAGLANTPAYKRWADDGKVKFSVKGKSFNELQKEMARLNRFISAETSTVRGVNNVLKEMAVNTGIKYNNLKDLRQKADQFFELASKVEQYLRNVEDMASAIGYQKIWEVINEYLKDDKIILSDGKADIESMTKVISESLANFETGKLTDFDDSDNWWYLDEWATNEAKKYGGGED